MQDVIGCFMRVKRRRCLIEKLPGGAADLVSKVISRVIFGVTPFRVLITLLITYLLSPLPLEVACGCSARSRQLRNTSAGERVCALRVLRAKGLGFRSLGF